MNVIANYHIFPHVRDPGRAPASSGSPDSASSQPAPEYARQELALLPRLMSWIFNAKAASKKIILKVDSPIDGLIAMGDEIELQRALEVLVENAIEFSPPGSTVLIAARSSGGVVRDRK